MPVDPKAMARGQYASQAIFTAAFAFGAYKVKPTWGKVVLGVLAALGAPALIQGPKGMEMKIIARQSQRAMVQAKIPGVQSKEDEPVIDPGKMAGYGSPFAAAVI